MLIAIPSQMPGGLDAGIDAHFGHCQVYTLVTVDAGQITKVEGLPPVAHVQGGCMAPVNHLAQSGVNVLISGGMGMRPLMGFQQVGIDVFHGNNAATVREAVEGFLAGSLPRFSQEFTCGGG